MYAQNVHIKEKGAIAERKNNKCKKKGMIYIMDKIAGVIAQELGVKEFQVQNTIKLIDDGNTIPFIARYRKEATGGLSDEVLRNLNDRLTYLRNLNKRKEEISKSIEEQGKMTDELKIQIENAIILSEVEDIYRPYKQKKRTRASIAKEKGLEPLATIIYLQTDKRPVLEIAKEFINEEKGVNNEEEALTGAKDIIAENISDVAEYRKRIKQMCYREGLIKTKATNDEEKSSYEMYYDFSEKINRIPSHRILAINRGEKEDFLKVKLEKPEDTIINYIENDIIKGNTEFTDILKETINDSFKRLIEPSIDREIRSDLTEKAEEQAIKVFGKNAKQLLLGSPIKGQTVMGFDPAYRTGCKIAVIDETGKVLDTATIYPTAPQNDVENSKKTLLDLIKKDNINIIAIGNGTASRESEQFVSDLIKEASKDVNYAIVSEAGASVYSASKLATEEYPDINVSIRGAISIARRLQDPLAELVKIDPKSIGVGQYQHDVNQKRLSESLSGVVEDSVNSVGVDVNTATPSLLTYVSGLNNSISKNIVKYRDENGKFKNRKELLKVAKLGKSAYEQCAGFIRIYDGDNPLEVTAVHPESYEIAENLLKEIGCKKQDLRDKEGLKTIKEKLANINIKETSKKLNTSEITLKDIIEELSKPGRDPREDMPKQILRSDVLKFEDLKEGMVLNGTVRNVIDFGAFVDIGVKHDGLVHISEMSNNYVKNPSEIVSVGDIVKVKVIGIDNEKQKVKLSMKI
ncbi:transcriptional accessory protein [Clostridium sp. CAG:452]|jgi:RNA binding S1 domain protein|nr:transcriptional accessory protein [Clostridium sp. CAG:452]